MKSLFACFACALLLVSLPLDAQAKEQLNVYEVNEFIEDMNIALNSPDSLIGKSFLTHNVADTADFDNNLLNSWSNPDIYQHVWYKEGYHPLYHRYPYVHSPYFLPSSFETQTKWEKIGAFESKKRLIPGYSLHVTKTGLTMPADKHMAVVDVNMKEFGLRYVPHRPDLTARLQHTDAQCKMYLGKEYGSVYLSRMTCDTSNFLPL